MPRLAAASLIATVLVSSGCAASLRGAHQSAAYFERCHGADFDGAVTLQDKQLCWSAWIEHYSDGQPPHRIRYAEDRRDALRRGETLPPLPGVPYTLMGSTHRAAILATAVPDAPPAEPGTEPVDPPDDARTGAAPGPEPEVDRPEPVDRAPVAERHRPRAPGSEGSPCMQVCAPRWDGCIRRCDDRERGCMGACEAEHRTCMAGCF